MKKEIKEKLEKRKISILLVVIIVIIVVCIVGLTMQLKENKEYSDIGRLTTIYENNKKNPTDKMKGSDVYIRDEEGNILAEHKGKYELPDDNTNSSEKVDKFVLDFTEGINSGKYEDVYSLFNNEYIEDFEYDFERFKRLYTFNGKVLSEVMNVKENTLKDRVIVTVKFTESSTGYILVTDFTLFNDGTIADIEVKNKANLNASKTIDNVTYTLDKRYSVNLGSIFLLGITNSSDKVVDVTDMLIKNNSTICTYSVVSEDQKILVYPGQTFKFRIKTPNNDNITSIVLKNKQLDGSIQDVEIYKK